MVFMNDFNKILQALRALAIHLPSGIAAPVLHHAPSEKVIVILIPNAMEIFAVALIIACSFIFFAWNIGDLTNFGLIYRI